MKIESSRLGGVLRYKVLDGQKIIAITVSKLEADRIMRNGGWIQANLQAGEQEGRLVNDQALPLESQTIPSNLLERLK